MNEDHSPRIESADSDSSLNGLTSIHARIHCVATQDRVEPENEIDRIMIDSFLETLSEIALAVAARGTEAKQQDERD
jgi:hypothetical protein